MGPFKSQMELDLILCPYMYLCTNIRICMYLYSMNRVALSDLGCKNAWPDLLLGAVKAGHQSDSCLYFASTTSALFINGPKIGRKVQFHEREFVIFGILPSCKTKAR